MRLKLTIDEGNSSTKVALWEGYAVVRKFDSVPSDFASLGVDGVILSSVRKESDLPALLSKAPGFINLSAETPLPLVIDYASPHTLGADRIAAAVGAKSIAPRGGYVLVVDIGTAVTYDLLYAGEPSVFKGGNIAPGIALRLDALHNFTSALPAVSIDGPVPLMGTTTDEAMRSGAVRGIVAEIEYYHSQLSNITTVLTGGSAEVIAPYISSPFILEPDLVTIGLKSILDYNENL